MTEDGRLLPDAVDRSRPISARRIKRGSVAAAKLSATFERGAPSATFLHTLDLLLPFRSGPPLKVPWISHITSHLQARPEFHPDAKRWARIEASVLPSIQAVAQHT